MGMYDNIGKGYQIKCFYVPIIAKDLPENFGLPPVTKLSMWASGGNLMDFHMFSKVPYKTMWYDYGKDFLIFDPNNVDNSGMVHIIRQGRYIGSVHHRLINTTFTQLKTVIDKNGEFLDMKTKEHMQLAIKDFANTQKDIAYYLKEFWKLHKDDADKEEAKRLCTHRVTKMQQGCHSRWYLDNELWDSRWYIGAFLWGLHTFAKTDEEVLRYVNYLKAEFEEPELERMITEYALWCSQHKIPITLNNLQLFFFNHNTTDMLSQVIWSM